MIQKLVMLLIPLILILADIAPPTQAARVEEPHIQSIALYYSPRCPYSQKVLSYMREENISIPLKDVTVDAVAKEELKTIGGNSVVPCLIVDGKAIYESDAIIEWLKEHKKALANSSAVQ